MALGSAASAIELQAWFVVLGGTRPTVHCRWRSLSNGATRNATCRHTAPCLSAGEISRRRHLDTAQAAAIDGALHQSRRLGFLNEFGDVGRLFSLALRK